MKFLHLAFAVLLIPIAAHAELEVVKLRYRTAEEIIPTLKPLVEPGGALSGTEGVLVIRASRGNIDQLRQVVATLDRAPRKLLISVRQEGASSGDARGAGVSGTIGSGDVRVGAGERVRRESGANVIIYDTRASRDDRVTSQVQTLEGRPAYIAAGRSVPVQGTVVTPTPSGPIVEYTTGTQTITTGFYVTPRVAEDRVVLEIATQTASPGSFGAGSANVHSIENTVSGRLGEWLPLGGIGESASRSQSGIVYGTAAARTASSTIWVKVDEIQ